jgi:hypothetical protein
MFVGRAFFHVFDGILGVWIGLGWGVLLLGLDLTHTDLSALLLTILVTTFSTSGLGLLLGCVSLVSLDTMFINNLRTSRFSSSQVTVLSQPPAWLAAISLGTAADAGPRPAALRRSPGQVWRTAP